MVVAVSVWPIRGGQFGVGKNGSGSNWEWPQLVVNILAWTITGSIYSCIGDSGHNSHAPAPQTPSYTTAMDE